MGEFVTAAAQGIEKAPRPAIWGFLYLLLIIVTTVLNRLIHAVLRGSRTISVHRDITYAVVRELFNNATSSQAQYVHASTSDGYTKGCKSWKCPVDTVSLDNGARVHWIGRKSAAYVLLYFHGGGYIIPSTDGHWEYQYKLREKMIESGGDISVLSLSYTLAPNATYPTQLRQAVSALRYLVETEGRDPSTIIVGGDSAGGNLVSAFLLHLAKPHADVAPVELRTPLHGAMLISPWISCNYRYPSIAQNEETDYITTRGLQKAMAELLPPGGKPDVYNDPLSAPLEWWAAVRTVVAHHFFIWGGTAEILIDSIAEFGTKLKEAPGADPVGGTVQLVITPGESHEQMIVDPLLMLGSKTAGGPEVEKWLAKMLTSKV